MDFTEKQILELKNNKYVKNVTTKSISFTKEFKEHFIDETQNGKGPTRIFIESGFNPYTVGSDRIDGFSTRIKNKYKNNESFDDNRGKKSTGRSKKVQKRQLSSEEEIKQLKQENLMLKAENELLKKMEFLVKQQELKKSKQSKDTN